jgi:hypothetical protein
MANLLKIIRNQAGRLLKQMQEISSYSASLYRATCRIEELEGLLRGEPPFELDPVEHDWQWVNTRFVKELPMFQRGLWWYRLDNKFWLCDYEGWNKLWGLDWIDQKPYIAERFDCDAFALAFKARASLLGINGCAVVVDADSRHAYNLLILPSGELLVFEPQSDGCWTMGTRLQDLYPLKAGYILL